MNSTPSRCDWCGMTDANHTEDQHPLPRDHADYDAFWDAPDDELVAIAVNAFDNGLR